MRDLPNIQAGTDYSIDKLTELRERLSRIESNAVAVVCGSYGRKEAFDQSDLDYFVLRDSREQTLAKNIESLMKELQIRPPSPDGIFAGIGDWSKFVKQDIGGEKDTNRNISQRVLLLLEGDYLFGKDELNELRETMLDRYVRCQLADHRLTLFLLNDIIRFWRTMCVDYEHKVQVGKADAIRNIKLVFSRKLLYASGLFSVALTADLSRDHKVERLNKLLSLSVVERMLEICGEQAMKPALTSYDEFLACMACSKTRGILEGVDGRKTKKFRELKNEGHRFDRELLKLFETTFHTTHPIRRSIIY